MIRTVCASLSVLAVGAYASPFFPRRTALGASFLAVSALARSHCDAGQPHANAQRAVAVNSADVSYINGSVAKQIDDELMASPGFSVDQLMELAGLSVATAAHRGFPNARRVLVVCGPGNNGGDGLVAARHLYHFGYEPVVVYPKRSNKTLFHNLIKQCHDLGIPVLDDLPRDGKFDLVVDAIFGFSFKGEAREPFKSMIASMANSNTPVLSVDVPSGWHVSDGDVYRTGLVPAAVVSLTLPKECMRNYSGRHFIGGRFVPPSLAAKYGVRLPPYSGDEQVLELTSSTTCSADESSQVSVLYVTAPNIDEARRISGALVERHLVACVNLVPGVESVYRWNNKVERDQEILMMIKTRKNLVPAVTEAVKELHPYEVPETIALDVVGGNDKYLEWVRDETK